MFYLALGMGLVCCAFLPIVTNKLLAYKCKKRDMELPVKINWNTKTILLLGSFIMVLFLSSTKYFNDISSMLFIYFFTAIAIICTVIDYKIRIIPNEMVLVLLILGLAFSVYNHSLNGLLSSLASLCIVVSIFLLCMLIMKYIFKISNGFGAGDIKISAAIAVAVGYPNVYIFLMGMACAVCVYCLGGILMGRLTLKSTFPMCGVIMAGFLAVLYKPLILVFLKS